MNSSKLLTPVIGIGFLGAALAIAAWPPREHEKTARPATPVRVAEVVTVDDARTIRFSGTARAADRARLAFTVPGRLTRRSVDVGDVVACGEELASLDAREYRLAEATAASMRAELEVRLAQAERDRSRVEKLAEARAATTEEVEKVSAATEATAAALEAASLRLDEARRLVAESTLVAPFAGTVTAVRLQPGEWASPGMPVIELSGGGDLEVLVEVPEAVAIRVHSGQSVAVDLPASGKQTTGRVDKLSMAAIGAGSLFPLVVKLAAHPDLLPGSTVEVQLEVHQERALGLPLDAVLNPGSSTPSVFLVADGRAEQVFLDLGRLDGGLITVEGSLAAGDQVVVAGNTSLVDGDLVEVLR